MKNEHIFTLRDKERLRITTYGDFDGGTVPCLIGIHGFKGFKDWGFWPYVGRCLAESGFFVITFNFSHNGIGDGVTEFVELDKFARNTFSREIDELCQLIDAVMSGFFGEIEQPPALGLLGHSRGGGTALLSARQKHEVQAVATWAAVSSFDRWPLDLIETWRQNGIIEILNSRTGQKMPLHVTLLDDIETHKNGQLNIRKATTTLGRPLLIVHGEADESVPVSEADRLFEWARRDWTGLHKIPGAGHTFNAAHPFTGSNPLLDDALQQTRRFFERHLKG